MDTNDFRNVTHTPNSLIKLSDERTAASQGEIFGHYCVCVRAVLSLDSESSVPAVPSGLMRTSRGLSDSWLSVCLCARLYVLVCLSVSVPVSLP